MRTITLCLTVAALLVTGLWATSAEAAGRTRTHNDIRARRFAYERPWHGPYYHTEYGMPLALAVPPTASMQTQWSWGVAQTRVVDNYHQFGRSYPGFYGGTVGGQLYPTPPWPSHTDQFGVYYIRGPW